jgi:hypothetical protein
MQYYLHAGVGLRRRVGADGAFTAGLRLAHLSNNMTTPPNLGLNMPTVVIGYAHTLR